MSEIILKKILLRLAGILHEIEEAVGNVQSRIDTLADTESVAKYYTEEDMPVKLCYMGNTFINSSDYQGRLKETTQCGVELIGDASAAADAEILAMVVASLQASGLKDFQISVGHARFFQGLVEAAGLSEDAEEELRELIARLDLAGVHAQH